MKEEGASEGGLIVYGRPQQGHSEDFFYRGEGNFNPKGQTSRPAGLRVGLGILGADSPLPTS